MKRFSIAVVLALCLATATGCASESPQLKRTDTVEAKPVGKSVPHTQIIAGGQPDKGDLESLQRAGIEVVVDLRGPTEDRGFPEPAHVEQLGMRYVSIPLTAPADLNPNALAALKAATRDVKAFVHCGSGQRAGAAMAVLLADQGIPVKEALAIGRDVGMTRWEAAIAEQLQPAAAPSAMQPGEAGPSTSGQDEAEMAGGEGAPPSE